MVAIQSEDSSSIAASIGAALRLARQDRAWSTRELAARADVSQPFLSNVENGRTTPSVATLYRLAAALELSPAALMPSTDEGTVVVRAGTGARVPISDVPGTVTSQLLSGARDRAIEAFRYDLPSGFIEPEWFAHDGEDFVYVLDGSLIFMRGQDEEITLGVGDSLWHASHVRHRWRTDDTCSARVLLVTVNRPTSDEPSAE
ncbi:helix-turn-helix domain-containing protein [Phytoactinopolyspora endophytica]|uniref:helix-turn-helix domain-containing protein n=1 Tax=Phytoactinopolyspora endophytica TaxID=1642495 RepID=UPI0013ED1327|nr:XRE family transcriptional regulator [Phytoactinopolyspora endophytica]